MHGCGTIYSLLGIPSDYINLRTHVLYMYDMGSHHLILEEHYSHCFVNDGKRPVNNGKDLSVTFIPTFSSRFIVPNIYLFL